MLLIRHRKLGLWLPPGGHLDPDEIPHEGAAREVREETGLDVHLIELAQPPVLLGDGVREQPLPPPFALSYQIIPERPGEGSHIHLDMAYAFEADPGGVVVPAAREVADARWCTSSDIAEMTETETVAAVRTFADRYLRSGLHS